MSIARCKHFTPKSLLYLDRCGHFTTELGRDFKQCLLTMPKYRSTSSISWSWNAGAMASWITSSAKSMGSIPGTFYNWVSRLRKKACHDIPDPVSREHLSPPAMQEMVRLDLGPKTDSNPSSVLSSGTIQEIPEQQAPLAAMIEISLGRTTL